MNRDFKGVWIPKEIWLDKDLTMLEKVLLTEISSLDTENHCIAGNEYFAEFCNCSESSITKAIRHLQDLNLIEILNFDGRHRKLRVLDFTRQSSKIYEAEYQNLRANNISNNTNKKSLIDKSIKDIGKTENSLESTFIQKYNKICTNLPKCLKLTDKRIKAIKNLLKQYDWMEIEDVFRKANESAFLTGKNDRGWKADIDFLLREDKFVSIMENKYGGKAKNSASTEGHLKLDRNIDKQKFREDIASGKAEKF